MLSIGTLGKNDLSTDKPNVGPNNLGLNSSRMNKGNENNSSLMVGNMTDRNIQKKLSTQIRENMNRMMSTDKNKHEQGPEKVGLFT